MADGLGSLFTTGGVAEQLLLWGVVNQFLSSLLQPVLLGVLDDVWPKITTQRLSPAELADMVVRGITDETTAAGEAASSGLSADRFHKLYLAAGEPPGLQQALEAWRRQLMPEGPTAPDVPSLHTAVLQSRLRPEWFEVVKGLGVVPVPPGDAVDAVVKTQIDRAEGEHLAYLSGVDAAGFDVLYKARGNPPGPAELIEGVRRAIIAATGTGPDVLSLEQGIHESAIKNKWVPVYEALLEYLPPPRTVTALLRAGSIDKAQALDLFQKAGLSQQLAAAYVEDASHQRLASDKLLAKDTVLQLYSAQVIPRDTAASMLGDLKYSTEEAGFLLTLSELQRSLKAVNAAVSKVGNLYIARRIDSATASRALDSLKLPASQRDELLLIWGLERDAAVRVLSEATIAAAWKYQALSDEQALTELQGLGYTLFDAWVYLAVHNKGAGPEPKPAPTVTAIGV